MDQNQARQQVSVENRSEPVDQGQASAWPWRWAAVLQHMRFVDDEAAHEGLVQEVLTPQRPVVLAFVNAHAFNLMVNSREFYQSLCSSDVLLRDGIGVLCLTSMMGYRSGLNMNGTDLIPKLIKRSSGKRVAFYGTCEPFLGHAVSVVADSMASGASLSSLDGFQSDSAYLQKALADQPDVIILGMGMPKQERIAKLLRSSLTHPCLIICGGAIIDFLGGRIKRAPSWIRKSGFEWLYRLVLEPNRLFARYVLGNPVFLARAIRMRFY